MRKSKSQDHGTTFKPLDEVQLPQRRDTIADLNADITSNNDSAVVPRGCLRRTSSDDSLSSEEKDETTSVSPPSIHSTSPKQNNNNKPASTNGKPLPKNVSFHQIEIAEHEYELGDNPSVNGGCPIQIGWEPMHTIAVDVEEYEEARTNLPHRSREQMRLPPTYREHLAKQAGASRSEVEQATQQARKINKSRLQSIKAQPWDKLHYRLEKTSRALRKATSVESIKRLGKIHSSSTSTSTTSRRCLSSADLRELTDEDEESQNSFSADGRGDLLDVSKHRNKFNLEEEKLEATDDEESDEPLSF